MAVNRQFIIFVCGVFLTFAGITGVLTLVSSINIEDGLGTTSMAVAFATSLLAAFIIPMLIERFGCRRVIVTAEICYLLFVIANVYPSYNLILGGIFYGIGEACVWTAYPIISSRFATTHSTTGSKSAETYINHYICYLFTAVQVSIVFGNSAGFLVLYIDRRLSNRTSFNHTFDYSICGANDCQISNVTEANLEQYTPAFVATRYIVIGVFASLMVVAIILHVVFLPKDHPVSMKKSKPQESDDVNSQCNSNPTEQQLLELNSLNDAEISKEISGNLKIRERTSGGSHLKSTITESLKLFLEPKHLLIMLIPFYNGMVIGFIISEVTRAFAACILGLDKVSVGSILYGLSDAVISLIAGKFAGKYGRNLPYAFAFVLDMANYLFCLMWQITDDNSWIVYFLFLSFGVTDGIWQVLSNVMYGEYFVKRKEIAFNLWNVLVNIGTFFQFAISTSLCVYHKLYIQIALLCTAVFMYSISQFIYYHPSKCKSYDVSKEEPSQQN